MTGAVRTFAQSGRQTDRRVSEYSGRLLAALLALAHGVGPIAHDLLVEHRADASGPVHVHRCNHGPSAAKSHHQAADQISTTAPDVHPEHRCFAGVMLRATLAGAAPWATLVTARAFPSVWTVSDPPDHRLDHRLAPKASPPHFA